MKSDEASLELAKANAERYRNLSVDGSGSRQEAQHADTQLKAQQAGLERDKAGVDSARKQISIYEADLEKAVCALERAKASLAFAELNLSYTRITAPIDGTVARRSVREGAFVTIGSPLLAIVPLEKVYIEANFRETQLARIRPGQAVSIRVDTLPGVVLSGCVASLSPASGASFAPVAPQNATGNFTKVVQRLPVRISINPGQAASVQLRVGMSVQPTIEIGADQGALKTAKADSGIKSH